MPRPSLSPPRTSGLSAKSAPLSIQPTPGKRTPPLTQAKSIPPAEALFKSTKLVPPPMTSVPVPAAFREPRYHCLYQKNAQPQPQALNLVQNMLVTLTTKDNNHTYICYMCPAESTLRLGLRLLDGLSGQLWYGKPTAATTGTKTETANQ